MKKYEKPEVSAIIVMAKDVITLSDGGSGNGNQESFENVFATQQQSGLQL